MVRAFLEVGAEPVLEANSTLTMLEPFLRSERNRFLKLVLIRFVSGTSLPSSTASSTAAAAAVEAVAAAAAAVEAAVAASVAFSFGRNFSLESK